MKVNIRFTNGRELHYDHAIDCYLKDGFLHVVSLWRGKPKTFAFNKDNIDEFQTSGEKHDS